MIPPYSKYQIKTNRGADLYRVKCGERGGKAIEVSEKGLVSSGGGVGESEVIVVKIE
jgi:hypothetical protein